MNRQRFRGGLLLGGLVIVASGCASAAGSAPASSAPGGGQRVPAHIPALDGTAAPDVPTDPADAVTPVVAVEPPVPDTVVETVPEPPDTVPEPPAPAITGVPVPPLDVPLPAIGKADGPETARLQQRLLDLGFWVQATDGTYGLTTRQAVMAFQKAEGLDRDGVAGPDTRGTLETASRPEPRFAEGDHLEVDLERQLLLVVRDGRVQWALNTSTGSGEAYNRPSGGSGVARTPRGEFEIERQINGVRRAELGVLYRPKYFHGGIAVHGSGSVPAHPASHGCVRLTNAAMDLLWSSDVAPIGTEVHVY